MNIIMFLLNLVLLVVGCLFIKNLFNKVNSRINSIEETLSEISPTLQKFEECRENLQDIDLQKEMKELKDLLKVKKEKDKTIEKIQKNRGERRFSNNIPKMPATRKKMNKKVEGEFTLSK